MARRRATRTSGPVVAVGLLAGGVLAVSHAAAPPATHTVTIEAMRFAPESLPVHRGDEVIWINRDPFPHTVRSVAGGFRSPDIAPGGSWRYRVSRSGVLAYSCTLHPTMNAELRAD